MTTLSTRRDGRTAATVPDEVIMGVIRQLWGEAERHGGTRPTVRRVMEVVRARRWRIGNHRVADLVSVMLEDGDLPELPMDRQQRGGLVAAAAARRDNREGDNHEAITARAAQVRAEGLGRRARPRPLVAAPGHEDMVRDFLRRERRVRAGV